MSREYTLQEVAEIADRSVTTIKKWVKRKRLKAHKSRQYLVNAADLKQFLLEDAARSRPGPRKQVKA